MSEEIPFARLGIPPELRVHFQPGTPRGVRLAMARGLLPTTVDVQLAICYLLSADEDAEVAAAARQALEQMPVERVEQAIQLKTHPKVLELIAECRRDPVLDERIAMHKLANDRSVRLVARRAGAELCERLCQNHERLLMTPELYLDLHGNRACPERALKAAEGFLRMEGVLPETVGPQGGATPPTSAQMDLQAEILAALAGEQSPALLQAQQEAAFDMFDVDKVKGDIGNFEFGFTDDTDELSWLLTADHDGFQASSDEVQKMEAIIREMTPGQKIKLAYLGNQETRGILIRDSNKLVAVAVVRSGRMSDGEGLAAAANRNLADDVIREIATSREWVRKYPFQVALVNNPKAPVSATMGFIRNLNRRDLQNLVRNRNVPGAVNQAAIRLFREKYKDQ